MYSEEVEIPAKHDNILRNFNGIYIREFAELCDDHWNSLCYNRCIVKKMLSVNMSYIIVDQIAFWAIAQKSVHIRI